MSRLHMPGRTGSDHRAQCKLYHVSQWLHLRSGQAVLHRGRYAVRDHMPDGLLWRWPDVPDRTDAQPQHKKYGLY